jgi:hypothetical protein
LQVHYYIERLNLSLISFALNLDHFGSNDDPSFSLPLNLSTVVLPSYVSVHGAIQIGCSYNGLVQISTMSSDEFLHILFLNIEYSDYWFGSFSLILAKGV